MTSDIRIILTECRCDMNDTGTICHRNVSITCYKKSLFMLLIGNNLGAVIKWLIFLVLKIFTFVSFKYFVSFMSLLLCEWRKYLIGKCLGQIIGVSVCCFNLDISIIRIHTECHVTWQCPRCCGPCEEVSILSCNLKTNDCGALLDRLVSLCNFL